MNWTKKRVQNLQKMGAHKIGTETEATKATEAQMGTGTEATEATEAQIETEMEATKATEAQIEAEMEAKTEARNFSAQYSLPHCHPGRPDPGPPPARLYQGLGVRSVGQLQTRPTLRCWSDW